METARAADDVLGKYRLEAAQGGEQESMPVARLVELIARGVPILVPFDKTQQNQEHVISMTTGGKRAHWGVVRGVVTRAALSSRWAEDAAVREGEVLPKVRICWFEEFEEFEDLVES